MTDAPKNDAAAGNPLLERWDTPFGAPPFDRIQPAHFEPAFAVALERHRAEIDAIAGDPATPTIDNTIAALERSGEALERVVGDLLAARRRQHQST